MKKIYLLLLIALVACSKDETKETEDPYFELNKTVLHSSSAGRSFDLSISTNVTWEILSHPDWVNPSVTGGDGDGDLQLEVEENFDGEPRDGHLMFQYATRKLHIELTQEEASLKLIAYTGSDASLRMDEAKFLLFNRPVKLNYIMSGTETTSFFIEEDDVEYFNDNRGIKFTKGPSPLGGDFRYKYSIIDKDNRKLEDLVSIKFYSQKFSFPGSVRKIILDKENNLWVLSIRVGENSEASYIYKFTEKEGNYEQEMRFETGLDYSPTSFYGGDFFINPHNDLIYIPNWSGEKVEVYSQSGELIKEIHIEPGSSDHPDHPYTNPYSIGFNKAGKGIISLVSRDISGMTWRFIDSSNADEMTEPNRTIEDDMQLQSYKLNYDASKLYAISHFSSHINVLNPNGSFEQIDLQETYYGGAGAVRITPNKLDKRIYVSGSNSQQIISEDMSYLSQKTSAPFYMGDFSYDPELPNHIYAINSDTDTGIELIDYNTGGTIFKYPIDQRNKGSFSGGLITSPDGEHIIIYGNSQMIILKTEMFE